MSNLYMEDPAEVKICEDLFEMTWINFLSILLNEKSKVYNRICGMLFLRNRLREIRKYT